MKDVRLSIAPIAALLASVGLLVLGNGLLGTLLVVRAGNENFAGETIGIMMSVYFAGYALGSVLLSRIIVSTGHIRAFAGFASVASVTALLHLLFINPLVWTLLRAVTGFTYAGLILVVESWLNAHAVTATRGRLLSLYGVVTMGVWALGQGLLNLSSPDGIVLFLVVSILLSLALTPITLLPSRPPTIPQQERLSLYRMLTLSPLGTLGAFLSGLALSAFWGMGPNFAQQNGLDTAGISIFMASVLAGALVLQWPLGWLSDHAPRRLVIAGAALAAGPPQLASFWSARPGFQSCSPLVFCLEASAFRSTRFAWLMPTTGSRSVRCWPRRGASCFSTVSGRQLGRLWPACS